MVKIVKMGIFVIFAVFLSRDLCYGAARGGDQLGHSAGRAIAFREISNLRPVGGPGLIGGDPVKPEDWAVFYTTQGNSRCTGTLIGPQVVASAAHCMSNGGALSLNYKGKVYFGKCSHAPEYRGNSTADWALCKLSEKIPDAIAESILTDPKAVTVGSSIRLMGYGCIRTGGGGGNDGVLRSNLAKVTKIPSGRDYDTVTEDKAALCYGDSGGPSWYEKDGKRLQVAINSRGNIRDTSYLSTISAAPALTFYRKFAADNGVQICGLDGVGKGCREKPTPPPPELPQHCKDLQGAHWGVLSQCMFSSPMPVEEQCNRAMGLATWCLNARLQ